MAKAAISAVASRAMTAVFCIAVAASVGSTPADAQFICSDGVSNQGATAAGGTSNTACGPSANASGNFSQNSAFGTLANASGNASLNVAVGEEADASGDGGQNTATGVGARAAGTGGSNIATGPAANATGNSSTNIASGSFADASGTSSHNIAIGDTANATGAATSNIAIGNHATATGTNSTAIGLNAQATFANSAAFGNGATATRANQQTFGTVTNTYTMAGIASAASRSAQSGQVQLVTSDTGGNLATTTLSALGFASTADLGAINSQLGAINSRLDDLSGRMDKAYTGVAMAFAMAGVPQLLPNEKFAVATNYGTFESKNGMALAAAMRITDHMQFNAGIGYGFNESIVGARAGLRIGF